MSPRSSGPEPTGAVNRRYHVWRTGALGADRGRILQDLGQGISRKVRVHVYSSTTWRPLAPFLEGELLVEGLRPEFRFFEDRSLDAEIAGPGRGDPAEIAVLAQDDLESYGSLYEAGAPFGKEEEEALLEALLSRAERLLRRCPRIVVLLPPAPPRAPHPLDRALEGGLLSMRVEAFSARLGRELLARAGIEALSEDSVLSRLGEGAFDPRLWEIGRIRYSEAGFLEIAKALAQRILLQQGAGIKAVVVDLDNTLWGGIAGEDGIQGIALGGAYPGSCFREFQKELKRWKRSGLVLAAASKNDRAAALKVMDGHPEMLLRSKDFDLLEIHWEPKADSLRRIVKALNIGAEAVLFIDDNPAERLAAAAELPGIRILDLPEDPLDFVECLREIPWPLFTDARGEHSRGELQAQQGEREAAASRAASRDEYLASLGIEVRIHRDDPAEAPRIAQLHAKTNQFNLDPVRLGERQILDAMEDPDRMVLSIRYADRFGDAGIVGASVARQEREALVVETFLLSCRVIGLGVERALLRALLDLTDAGEIRLPFRRTERNAPALDFLGTLDEASPEARGISVPRDRVPPAPAWIRVFQQEPAATVS